MQYTSLWAMCGLLLLSDFSFVIAREADSPIEAWSSPRRRDQTRTESGYVASPIAVNIPGIGFSYGVVGSLFNIAETEMDSFFFTSSGDSNGYGLGAIDTPITDWLSFNVFINSFRGTGLQSHRRGINSDPDQSTLIKFDRTDVTLGQLTSRFWNKRLQFNLGLIYNRGKIDSILDNEGELIARPEQDSEAKISKSLGMLIDLTDDRSDPRSGLQFESQIFSPASDVAGTPSYYIVDKNLLYYIPVGSQSTWVWNLFHSEAVVTQKGETDLATIKANSSYRCDQVPTETRTTCEAQEDQAAKEQLAFNKRGRATSLGGTLRLRSYVTSRFSSAHAAMAATELRWNLTDEFTPFNILVAGGIRTGLQIALFSEWGTVQEYASKLSQDIRSSYGIGFRAIIASGFIVRLDLAYGQEGWQPVLFFNYPWFVF